MDYFSKYLIKIIIVLSCMGMASCSKNTSFKLSRNVDDTGTIRTMGNPLLVKKVLFIGISGCKGKALKAAEAPHIKGLLPHAIYSYDAVTKFPTLDGPGWSSVLTGVWNNKHGVTDNTFSGNNFQQYPSIFETIDKVAPDLKTISISISSWDAINSNLNKDADVRIDTHGNDEAVKDSAVMYLRQGDPDVIFVEFNSVNHAGKQNGYDTTGNSGYMQEITMVDSYVGEILQTLNNRKNINLEDWLIIVSSEHGGDLNGPGDNSAEDKNTFNIFYNKKFWPEEIIPFKPDSNYYVRFADGSQSAYLRGSKDVDNVMDLNQYNGFTVSLNVKSEHFDGYNTIFGNKNWMSGGSPGWVITVDGSGHNYQGWFVNIGDGNGNRVDAYPDGAPDLADGKWHTVAITVDKSGKIKLFQDNILYKFEDVGSITDWNGSSQSGNGNILSAITDIDGNAQGSSDLTIANIKIWDTTISDADMKNYRACDTAVKYRDHLLAWWKANDAKGMIWKDYGPNNLDMEVTALNKSTYWEVQKTDLCNDPIPPIVLPTESVDIAPTLLSWLNIGIDPSWELDGKNRVPL